MLTLTKVVVELLPPPLFVVEVVADVAVVDVAVVDPLVVVVPTTAEEIEFQRMYIRVEHIFQGRVT